MRIIDDHEVCDQQLRAANKRADKAEQERDDWHDVADVYKRRCELYEEQEMGVAAACCDREMALPRVITADELRRGQKIAVFDHEESSIGVVASSSKYSIDFTNYGGWSVHPDEMPTIVLLADAPEPEPRERAGTVVSAYELQVGDIVDVWHGDDKHEALYPSATIESTSPLIAEQFDFEGLERSFPRFQFRLLKRPEKKHDLPGLTRVDYMDGSYEYFCTAEYAAEHAKSVQWDKVAPWRGTPVTPQSVRRGDVYDIHTAHGSTITGVLAGRDGAWRPQPGDQYRLVRKAHA